MGSSIAFCELAVQMFFARAHLWHGGIYIAKASYVRYGENAFQDAFYRQVHQQ